MPKVLAPRLELFRRLGDLLTTAEHSAGRKRILRWGENYVDVIANESNMMVGNFGGVA